MEESGGQAAYLDLSQFSWSLVEQGVSALVGGWGTARKRELVGG